MARRKANWLPEGARVATKDDVANRSFVSYQTPKGETRSYVAGDFEADFYDRLFRKALPRRTR